MMNESKVNANVARDLVSNAGSSASRVADMNDFKPKKLSERQNNLAGGQDDAELSDLRSIKSEYDYGSKRKFVDVLGNVSIEAKIKRMRAQHEIEMAQKKAGRVGPAGSLAKESTNSRVASYKTYSRTTKQSRYSKSS